MHILHLTKNDYKTSCWSGGTTTELFIWPAGADYATREFAIRISSATVDLEESDFTPLPGVQRWITPLSGGFTLTHPGKMPVAMAPLAAPYCFDGGEATHCLGKATDLNLMLKDISGGMAICSRKSTVLPGFNCFYALENSVFYLNGQHTMAPGDLLVVFSDAETAIDLGDAPAIVCRATVFCRDA